MLRQQPRFMGVLVKILKWIAIWTAILFVPVLVFGVIAAGLVGGALGAVASVGTMLGLAIVFFFTTPVLWVWVVGTALIIVVNLGFLGRKKEDFATSFAIEIFPSS